LIASFEKAGKLMPVEVVEGQDMQRVIAARNSNDATVGDATSGDVIVIVIAAGVPLTTPGVSR
jgi:hypothetical protein